MYFCSVPHHCLIISQILSCYSWEQMILRQVLIPWKISESVLKVFVNWITMKISSFLQYIINRSDKDFSKEICELNLKLKKYCLGRGFVYVNNDNINEYCLNKLDLDKKGTNLFSKNISTPLDVTWNASTDTKSINNTDTNLKKSHDIDQGLSDLRSTNLSNLNFCYLTINSVRNKFTDFQEIINGNVDVVSTGEIKNRCLFPLLSLFL